MIVAMALTASLTASAQAVTAVPGEPPDLPHGALAGRQAFPFRHGVQAGGQAAAAEISARPLHYRDGKGEWQPIGTSVFIPPIRPVAWAAKQIATFQYVSGNRLLSSAVPSG
ncbi:hypothetical protein ACTMTI_24185 [Nonomuraea sp. H19]|uniref:hypothetical protein n=1 Tax=Nonomuraea sp. H19 TaxID=3452206 RepID=UPI003F88C0BC